ncbi:MAG: hypothetical protein V4565_00430 [Bacteroidota bacterium]
MNSLKLIQEEITGTLNIVENCQYNNVNAETVVLEMNVTARLYGKVQNVVLKQGAVLLLHGTITGNVEDTGGTLHIFPG